MTFHTYSQVFGKEGWAAPAWPLLLVGILLLLKIFIGDVIVNMAEKCFPFLKVGNLELDEDLDTYWNSLDDHDRKWSIKEEEYFRHFNTADLSAYGLTKAKKNFSMLFDVSFDHLKTSQSLLTKTMQGTHSYDILANPKYYGAFNYVPIAQDEGDERADFIIDDDSDEGNDDW